MSDRRLAARVFVFCLVAVALAPVRAVAAGEEKLLGNDIVELIEIGGIVMVLILAGSIIGLAFGFERLVALRKSRLVPRKMIAAVRQAAEHGDEADLERIAAESRGPLARILAAGLRRRSHGVLEMERVMENVGAHEVARLKRPVRPLAVLATIEPLLGLLGTILGMINTFNLLHNTSASERVAKLAPGIGQALYTTAAGLCVAIPFVCLYHFLCGRVNRAAEEWSILGSDVVLGLTSRAAGLHGQAAPTAPPGTAKRDPAAEVATA